ncbi:MAG: enoyl-CoA hydratase-related protein [Nitrospiraceae bacterium]
MADWMSIIVESRSGIAHVTLNRPERRNAFDQRMVLEVHDGFHELAGDQSVRGVVLTGAGSVFCAGADLRWLSQDHRLSVEQARQDARLLAGMYRAIDEFPHPVIGRVQGNAFGGGVGLLAVCDVVVAAERAMFTLSEVQLGLIPAVIAPFLLRKAGESFMRRFCLTAEPFSAVVATQFNLVHDVVSADLLDGRIQELTDSLLRLAPEASRQTKALLHRLQTLSPGEQETLSVEANAQARVSAEAQEGLRAFMEKRPPAWREASTDRECEPIKPTTDHVAGPRT